MVIDMFKKKPKKIILVLIILLSLLLSGCEATRPVPELESPVQESFSLRPVERRNIGKMQVVVGNVVPTEYCHYFKKITAISDFKCDIGEYVTEGQVLAVADIEKLTNELEEKQAEKQLYINRHTVNKPAFDIKMDILKLEREELLNQHDYIGYEDMRVQIEAEEENHEYDEKLYLYMIDRYDREIEEIQKQISEGSLIAKKSGYVTYIKDTSKNNVANINEAVVIVADFEDTYIEIPSLTLFNNVYKDYTYKAAMIDGIETPIEAYDYTPEEVAFAKATENYPNVRYKVSDGRKLSAGETIPLIFRLSSNQNILTVGLDSVETDEMGQYVYVSTGDNTLEKRYFEYGASDDHYVEVIDGLEEGEQVYYKQEVAAPVSYKEYTVKREGYTQEAEAKNFKTAQVINKAFLAPVGGLVTGILKDTGVEVKKGETILIIDSNSGSAVINDYDNKIEHLTVDYMKNTADIERQIFESDYYLEREKKENKRQLLEDRKQIALINKQVLDLEYEHSKNQLIREKERINKNNDGSGKISVVAESDGIVAKNYAKSGKAVEKNALIVTCTKVSEGVALITFGSDVTNIPAIGAAINISVKGKDEIYTGTVISNAWNNKCYAFSDNGRPCISKVESIKKEGQLLVMLDDKEFFENNKAKDCKVKIETFKSDNMIVIDGSMVYTEKNKTTNKTDYFVWKMQKGMLTKQYIVTGREFGIGNDSVVVVLSGLEEGDIIAGR